MLAFDFGEGGPSTMAKVARWFAVVALVACLFGACTDDDDPDAAPTTAAVSPQASTPQATAETTVEPTISADLQALMLGLPSAADLGPGWEQKSRGLALPSQTTLCGEPADFTSDVIAAYTNTGSPHLSAIVGISRGEGVVDELRGALETCGELTSITDGRTTVYQVAVIESDTIGDDTLAIKATTRVEESPEPLESYFVIVEERGLVLAVVDTFIGVADMVHAQPVVIAAHDALQRVD